MKKATLFLLGFIPLIVGYLMNSWMMENLDKLLPYKLIGLILLVFWLAVGYMSHKLEKSLLKSSIIAHLPALFMLLLIMYHELISGRYSSNLFGWAPQFYYLPLLNLSSSVIQIFWLSIKGIWFTSLIALLFMYASYYAGYYLKNFRNEN